MPIQHITPQNYTSFIFPGSVSLDPRQYLPWHTVDMLANRKAHHQRSVRQFIIMLRGIADALDTDKPKAFKGLDATPHDMGIHTSAEIAAEKQRLRTVADYLESVVAESLPDPKPVG